MFAIFNSIWIVCVLLCILDNVQLYKVETEKDAIAYLINYGYVNSQVMPRGFTLQDCDKKLKEFQKLSLIPITGQLDNATIKAMNTPRCGCPDFLDLSFNRKSAVFPSDEEEVTSAYPQPDSRRRRHHGHHRHRHHWHNHNHSYPAGHHHHHRRHKRYVASGIKWKQQVVTYNIAKFPTRQDLKVSQREIENAIHKAFSIWEKHINLEFSYQPNNIEVDIEIRFETGYHNDNYPFDGPGKTLAHAFFPGTGLGGDVHFEEIEDWKVNEYNGFDILHVALHEIGHSLGLGHSSEYGSVMYPMYRGYMPDLDLHSDDIRGLESLYGRKQSGQPTVPVTTTSTTTQRSTTSRTTTSTTARNWNRPTTTTPTPNSNYNDLCSGERIDAIATLYSDAILVFKGTKVYEIGNNHEGVLPGWPKDIRLHFRGLEGNLDCALTRSNGKTYFFKGSKYWRFTGRQMDRGYPRAISEYFPGIPNDLDAAFEWEEEFVFVKGNKFWRFNTKTRPHVKPYFPFPISHWGLKATAGIGAAFTGKNGTVYFFEGIFYWEFDKISHKVLINNRSPGLMTEDWFGCREP